ncbi:hypothetical protein [Micromonospora sp. NPDC005367]|uniref:hypothetical protein n=1 Tax=Micromonospora sp. NPDC005367 TaxID=3155590 RepID=UPI0033A68C11
MVSDAASALPVVKAGWRRGEPGRHREAVDAVRMPCWVDGTLIGLAEVMGSVSGGESLHWRLFEAEFNGDIRAVWPQSTTLAVEGRSREPGGLSLSWSVMAALAASEVQIIDGDFVGFDDAGLPQLQLLMIDSGHWRVWSLRPADYAHIRQTFARVETVPHVQPEPAIH